MRLIDADANRETMLKCAENPESMKAELCYRFAARILEEAPTIDAISIREWNLLRNSIQELQENNQEKKDIQFVTKFLLRLMDISERRDKNEV